MSLQSFGKSQSSTDADALLRFCSEKGIFCGIFRSFRCPATGQFAASAPPERRAPAVFRKNQEQISKNQS
jgi:hypothetical protein